MPEINASTMLKVQVPAKVAAAKGAAAKGAAAKKDGKISAAGKGPIVRKSSVAPSMKPAVLTSAEAIAKLKAADRADQKQQIQNFLRRALGVEVWVDKSAPHAASTTKSRMEAAADVAIAAKELGVVFVLKTCSVIDELQRMLFPQGDVHALLDKGNDSTAEASSGLKPSASALSLASMASMEDNTTATSVTSNGTDANRGKTTPPNAREGSLLIIRALCDIVGRPAEPYIVGAFLAAALDECGSNSTSIRAVAEDATVALIKLAHPWAFPNIICPLILQSLKSSEWRVKSNALERLELCATTAPAQVNRLLPKLIPAITNQVWDTKVQVSKAAGTTLLAICMTGKNPDVAASIPAVVKAICKPSEANKAISELMGTTFVVPVDAPTLSILCPVLSRALKEKLAIHKRAACIVISNMSKLVETPEAVAPFGPLLVPELKRVATNVQFEEIRDEALKALSSLTKALGESYEAVQDAEGVESMTEQLGALDLEQKLIEEARQAEAKRQEEIAVKEAEERKKFKEAMDAQRELDKIALQDTDKKKKEELAKREAEKLSITGDGKCKSCGLKKCRNTCPYFKG